MDLSVLFAGTGGSAPTARRGLPAFLIAAGGDRLLVDCGEGTQRQLLQSAGLPDLDAIFITHFHADHWLGLPGMLKTFDLRAREKPLAVYGPTGLREQLGAVQRVVGSTRYPVDWIELERFDEVEFDSYVIHAFPIDHRLPGLGFALAEDERPGRFDPDEAVRLGVTPGPDFGRLQNGETVEGVRPDQVVGQDRPGRRVVFSGDTRPCQEVLEHAREADLLVHEATFTDSELSRARETGHSTARQAAEVARDAGVRLLALTHLSTRYFPREIRDEARATFADTVVPRDFDVIEIPFPERGAPALIKAGRSELSADADDGSEGSPTAQ
jgi:ribonuclease Z